MHALVDAALACVELSEAPLVSRRELGLQAHSNYQAEVVLQADELQDHKIVPVEKLRPWPQATGVAVKDWLAGRHTA